MNEHWPPKTGGETITAQTGTDEEGSVTTVGITGAGAPAGDSITPEETATEALGLCEQTNLTPRGFSSSQQEADALADVDVSIIEPLPGCGTILVAVADPPEALRVDAFSERGLPLEPAPNAPSAPDDDLDHTEDGSLRGFDEYPFEKNDFVSEDKGLPEKSEYPASIGASVIPDYSDLVAIAAVRLGVLGPASFFVADKDICRAGDKVVVELDEGLAFGEVTTITYMNPNHLLTGDNKENGDARGGSGTKIRAVVRKATEKDIASAAENATLAAEAMSYCHNCIRERNLDMKLVDVLVLLNCSKMVFYFTAPSRIDFRELVKDLVRSYRTRIELRQIGVRHETQMVGAVGNCGMVCCCRRHLRTFAPVAIKMAKEQNVFLNPIKISGICGRLLCCLAYEQEHYDEFYRRCPKLGKKYQTDAGAMRVLRASMFRESVSVLNESNEEVEYPLDAWNALNPHRPNASQGGGGQPQGKMQKQTPQKSKNGYDKPRQDESRSVAVKLVHSGEQADRDGTPPGDSTGTEHRLEAKTLPLENEASQQECNGRSELRNPKDAQLAMQQLSFVANSEFDDDGDDDDDEDGDSIFGLNPHRAPNAVPDDGAAAQTFRNGEERNMHQRQRSRNNRRRPRPSRQQ